MSKTASAKKIKKDREPKPKVAEWELRDAIQWTDKTKYESCLIVDAASYRKFVDDEFDYLPKPQPCSDPLAAMKDPEKHVMLGEYPFIRRILPTHRYNFGGAFLFGFAPRGWQRATLQIWQGVESRKEGTVRFTDDVDVPILLGKSNCVWMSTTPAEIMTQRPGLRYAHGHVLVGGLGLGWFAKKVCERKQVRKVTVVEKEQGLIDAIGSRLTERFDKLEIIQGDAYEALRGAEDRYDSVLYDIWTGWPEANWDNKFEEFAKRARGKCRVWAWGLARHKCS